MLEVIYMKAEYEPWWMFDGWEETIVSRKTFEDKEEAKVYLTGLLNGFRNTHKNEQIKTNCFFAFWSDCEKSFCEACDEDLQIYHGVISIKNGEPHAFN